MTKEAVEGAAEAEEAVAEDAEVAAPLEAAEVTKEAVEGAAEAEEAVAEDAEVAAPPKKSVGKKN